MPRRWEVLANIIQAEDFEHFVELGCKEGRTTAHILENCPNCHVITMDPWIPMPEQSGLDGGETYEAWDFEDIEAQFWKLVESWKERLTFYRRTSEAVAALVDDGTQDLIFIDASHDYESVLDDIKRWTPKLRNGGILAGHDFQHSFPTVMRAVADSFNLMFVETAPDSVWWVRC